MNRHGYVNSYTKAKLLTGRFIRNSDSYSKAGPLIMSR